MPARRTARGRTATPATTRAHASTLMHIIADSQARVLFASAEFAAEAARLAAEMRRLRHVFVMDTAAAGTRDYGDWLAAQADHA